MIIKTDPDIIKSYLEDSSNLKGGYADQVVIPSTVEELRAFVTKANLSKTPITISGGGTATTGSRIPFGGSVISVEKFNKISGIYPEKRCALVQTGVLVDHLKSECEKYNLFYTSHPTERSATIGGTVSTNASGSRSLKYGSTRRFIKWLRMVMATGEAVELRRGENIIDSSNLKMVLPGGRVVNIPLPSYTMPDVKSSAGYYIKPGMDLIDLFIGQEGTLSIIVDVEFGLIAKPANILSSFVFFDYEMDARAFAKDAKKDRDVLSVEYFDSNSLTLLYKKFKNLPAKKKRLFFSNVSRIKKI